MDRGARHIVNVRVGRGLSVLLLLALPCVHAGCYWGWHGRTPPPSGREDTVGDNTAPASATEWLPPAVASDGAEETAGASPVDDTAIDNAAIDNAAIDKAAIDNTTIDNTAIGAPGAVAPAAGPLPEEVATATSPLPEAKGKSGASPPPVTTSRAVGTPSARKPKPAAEPHPVPTTPPKDKHVASLPEWAKSPEELVYRVDFIGITMGYARFRYQGKVSIAGKQAYHLNVRAWTSGVLSYIYPINETIDYYLDAETIAPIRQEYTQREKEKDDVALY
ncbi:MAG: DUF3108 domain-containing protein, partial [bacterium]|nr:DUF3108 domain-containing protein [bacterium]